MNVLLKRRGKQLLALLLATVLMLSVVPISAAAEGKHSTPTGSIRIVTQNATSLRVQYTSSAGDDQGKTVEFAYASGSDKTVPESAVVQEDGSHFDNQASLEELNVKSSYTVFCRFAASDGYEASDWIACNAETVFYPLEVTVDYNNQQLILSEIESGYEYFILYHNKESRRYGSSPVALEDDWLGTRLDIWIYKKGTNDKASELYIVSADAVPVKRDAPHANGVNPKANDPNSGAIVDLTPETIYEVKKGTDGSWEKKSADADGKIDGLSEGTYYIRYPATGSEFPSKHADVVLIQEVSTKKPQAAPTGPINRQDATEGAFLASYTGTDAAGKVVEFAYAPGPDADEPTTGWYPQTTDGSLNQDHATWLHGMAEYTEYTIFCRFAETAEYKASDWYKEDWHNYYKAPQAVIDYEKEQLYNMDGFNCDERQGAGPGNYLIMFKDHTWVYEGPVKIPEENMGTDVTIYKRYGQKDWVRVSHNQTITIPARPVIDVKGIDPTEDQPRSGKLWNLAPNTAYKVSMDENPVIGAGTWYDVITDEDGMITDLGDNKGLGVGTYHVYLPATSSSFRSNFSSVELKIEQNSDPSDPDWGELTITKTANKTEVKPSDTITYTITVTNGTGAALKNITVSENPSEALTITDTTPSVGDYNIETNVWTIAELAANGVATLEIVATVSESATADTTVANTATITNAEDEDGGKIPTDNTPSDVEEVPVIDPTPDPVKPDWGKLTIAKTADKTEVKPGDTITYTITVTNGTGAALENITVSENPSEALTITGTTPSVGTFENNTWTIPTLDAGATATLQVQATVSADAKPGDKIANTATITDAGDGSGSDLPEGTTPGGSSEIPVVDPTPAPVSPDWGKLTVTKTANRADTKPGEIVTYTVKVTNGTGKDLKNIVIAENPASGLVIESATATAGTISDSAWTISSLSAGGEATLTVVARVSADAKPGDKIANTVSVTSAEDGDGNKLPTGTVPSGSATITVTAPEPAPVQPDYDKLRIVKAASRSSIRPGKALKYTIKVTNRTGVDLTNLVVVDDLDTRYLAFSEATAPKGHTLEYSDGRLTWHIPSLEENKSVTLTISVKVRNGVADGTKIENVAIIDKANGDDVPGPDPSDSVTVTVSNKISIIPETGDTSNIRLWIGVMTGTALVLAVVLFVLVKKKKVK